MGGDRGRYSAAGFHGLWRLLSSDQWRRGSGGGGTTGNRVYIANQAASSIGAFAIGTGTLAAVNKSPVATSYKPFSMVVTPNNALLYVGSATGGIFVYFINSDGSLTTPSTGSQPAGVLAPAMTVSPDGQWLIALDGTTQQLDIFQINASTGALTSVNASDDVLRDVGHMAAQRRPRLARWNADLRRARHSRRCYLQLQYQHRGRDQQPEPRHWKRTNR